MDLEQVIFTSNLTHSDVFYQRQYSKYNFAVHNMKDNQASMYLWHEAIGKRGANEIASCVLIHIKKNYSPLQPGELRIMNLWSDRCVGQNNNWTMIALCFYLIQGKYFSELNRKFLVSGHSFLPCDRDFALIEKKKKVATFHIPSDVIQMIKSARTTSPFVMHPVEQKDFLDFRGLINDYIKKDSKLKITEARWIQVSSDSPTVLKVRTTHNIMESWQMYDVLKKRRGRRGSSTPRLPTTLPQFYEGPLPIKKEKKRI